MTHESLPMVDTPIEFINVTPVNDLVSKCQIKVCYVQDEPNRNHSIITKDVAKEMANSLPGCPIVGYYNEEKGDFEEHNRFIEIGNGKITVKPKTQPYGFVDLHAKVWFQWFHDDDDVDREYLVTEGYLWTKAFPESERVIKKGNGQSMELDETTLDATWTKDNKGLPKFFIINEAMILKLCILGEDVEPCFEGANITAATQFSFEPEFKQKLFNMMAEIKELLQEGGEKVYTTYAVEIGDQLWSMIYDYMYKKYPCEDDEGHFCGSTYRIEGIYEEDNGQKFAILQGRDDGKYYRLNFSLTDAEGFVADENLVEVTKTYVPAEQPQFALAAIEEYEQNLIAEFNKNQDNSDENTSSENNNTIEDDENASSSQSSEPEPMDDNQGIEDKKAYSLEEIPEYVELAKQFAALEIQYNSLNEEKTSLEATIATKDQLIAELTEFKLAAERKDKKAMIDSFYMLNDNEKKDVLDNIDTYSLDDIEAKLSVICVRNKVSFAEDKDTPAQPLTYNVNEVPEDDSIPAWVKAALELQKTMN